MRPLRHSRIAVVLSALVLGSLSSYPTLAAPPAVDPCKLLTLAEVEQVVGKVNGITKPYDDSGIPTCEYELANSKGQFTVWIFPVDGVDRARKLAKQQTPIKGLGDDALMAHKMHRLDNTDLFIKKGGTTIRLPLNESPGDEEKLKAFGQKALGRL